MSKYHLRKEYLQFKDKNLEKLILSAIPTLAPIIGGLIYLKDLSYNDTEDMFRAASEGYGMDLHILEEIYDIQRGKGKFKVTIQPIKRYQWPLCFTSIKSWAFLNRY